MTLKRRLGADGRMHFVRPKILDPVVEEGGMRLSKTTSMPDTGQFKFGYGTIAAAGSTQAGATQIVNQITYVTAADGTKGVALPSMSKGMNVVVLNGSATANLKVYPFVGDSCAINALAADAAYTVPPGARAEFVGSSKTQVYIPDSVVAAVTAGTVAASKAVIVDANKDIGTFRNLRATRLIHSEGAPTSINTAGAATYTAAQMVGGIIVRDPNGASRSDALDTAANLVGAIPGATVGDIIDLLVVNGADATETITIGAGSGGGFDANQTSASRLIGQNASKLIRIRLTNVTPASEAYVVYC